MGQPELERGWGSARYLTRRLKKAQARLNEVFKDERVEGVVFLVPRSGVDAVAAAGAKGLLTAVSQTFECKHSIRAWDAIFPDDLPLFWSEWCVEVLVIYSAGVDAISECLINALKKKTSAQDAINLADYGLLLPRSSGIKCYSFAHGVGHFYRYRVDIYKLVNVPPALGAFLQDLPMHCPDSSLFQEGPRASSFRMAAPSSYSHVENHPCTRFADTALKNRKFRSAHEDVEKLMVETDGATIATEVPVWLEPDEMRKFGLDAWNGCLTGHIDVLRFGIDGRVEVWDFKPRAKDEERAHVQVFLYALMLSTRAQIPLMLFDCGYFDERDAFFLRIEESDTRFVEAGLSGPP